MKAAKLCTILITCLFLFGCTHMLVQPLHTITDNQISSKYELKTRLHLPEKLKNSKHEESAAGDTWIIPLGENLTHNSEVLVRSLFSESYITHNETDKQDKLTDIIITPRLVSVDQSCGIWAWNECTFTISLEWSLNDTNGNLLWVDTAKGTGTNEMGTSFTQNARTRDRVRMALEDLFKKSYHALSASKIIRDIDHKKRGSSAK